jgi:chromosome segregation ATPase
VLILLATDITTLLPLLGILIGPVLAYLLSARRLSGKITTSDATSLWAESGKLRLEYKTEMEDLRLIVTRLRERVSELEDKNEVLHLENGELRLEITRLRSENRMLKLRIEELEKELYEYKSS